MGNSDKGKAKELKPAKNEAPVQASGSTEIKSASKLHLEGLKSKVNKSGCCRPCFKIIFVVFALIAIPKISNSRCCSSYLRLSFMTQSSITIVKSIAEIIVTVSAAIATRLYSTEQSGKLVGLVILAVLAAVTISMLVYAVIAVFRNQAKPLHAASIVLAIVVAIQVVVLLVSIRVTDKDEQTLSKELANSFKLAKDNNPRHAMLWAATQHDLNCCGLYSPEDFRTANLPDYFPPNVPVSCCPAFDPARSELVQEKERERCKARRAYYDLGCKGLILELFRSTANTVIALTAALIVLELFLTATSAVLYTKVKKLKTRRTEDDPNPN